VQDFEIFIIDDASTDNTFEIIDRYTKIFGERLNYLKLETRVGRGEVRNHGLRLAKGEYITFLDADDAYCFNKIEMQSKYLDEHPKSGGVTCRFYLTNSFLQEPKRDTEPSSAFEILFGKDYSEIEEGTPALMVRREIIEQVGQFDERITRGQDTDLMIRIARVSKIDIINTPLYLYRQHENNSQSLRGIRERTKSNIILHKKIIDTEDDSTKDLAREFAFRRLAWHIFRLREHCYFEPIGVWFLYLCEFNVNLPLIKWGLVGLKAVVGYRLTQFLKRKISARF
jgi:glycosyltransferase involved in cell wall biosynthesis